MHSQATPASSEITANQATPQWQGATFAPGFSPSLPVKLNHREFRENKYAYYGYLRDNEPVHKTRMFVIDLWLVSRYEDCTALLKDPRFVRNRSKTGKARTPFPVPKSARALTHSMIIQDDPEHRRLRSLVQQAFTPRNLKAMEQRVEQLCSDLLDQAMKNNRGRAVDLKTEYALPIPLTVIQEMIGLEDEDLPPFHSAMRILKTGVRPWNAATMLLWRMPKTVRFLRGLIRRKRKRPGDDIFTALIHAEEEGDRLSEDELVSMIWLLTLAGFETTVHLINNTTLALLDHEDQLDRLRKEPDLVPSAIEEALRYCGPIQGTKPNYALEDVEWHGQVIPKGDAVMPLLASANLDPRIFENPEVFDITRSPNKHLGFGYGPHFCLGAVLARMEARIALRHLIERCPNLRLGVAREALRLDPTPFWHRLESLPVVVA